MLSDVFGAPDRFSGLNHHSERTKSNIRSRPLVSSSYIYYCHWSYHQKVYDNPFKPLVFADIMENVSILYLYGECIPHIWVFSHLVLPLSLNFVTIYLYFKNQCEKYSIDLILYPCLFKINFVFNISDFRFF